MTNLNTVMTELKSKGNQRTRETFLRHGAPDNLYGVQVADLKKIAKTIKGEQELAYELYDTGNGDAQYLAGIVADGQKMTKRRLQLWARMADWQMIAEYTVPGVAAESNHSRALANQWIGARKESVASTGWCTYSGLIATKPDDELDLDEISELLDRIVDGIDAAPNRVRYTMNGFVIAVGSYVKPRLRKAKSVAKKLGVVSCDMGDTSCKVPLATDYIAKVETAGRVGKKRKSAKC